MNLEDFLIANKRMLSCRHNRTYGDKKELLKRFRIYKRNLRLAKLWQKNEQGTAVYGETPFSDMTQEEFRKVATRAVVDQSPFLSKFRLLFSGISKAGRAGVL